MNPEIDMTTLDTNGPLDEVPTDQSVTFEESESTEPSNEFTDDVVQDVKF